MKTREQLEARLNELNQLIGAKTPCFVDDEMRGWLIEYDQLEEILDPSTRGFGS